MTAMRWWEGPLLSLDFETTTADPLSAVPVSVAFGLVDVGGHFDAWVTALVDPERAIPAAATAIHGITSEAARAGQPRRAVVAAIAKRLSDNATRERLPLVIYNVPFDWPVFILEAERAGIPLPHGQPLIDPLLLDRCLERYRKGSRKLADVARRWGVALRRGQAHTAGADVVAAVQTARALAHAWRPQPDERYTAGFRESDLCFPDFQRRQRELYAAWRDDRNAYWRRIGAREPDGTLRQRVGEWPCGPLVIGPGPVRPVSLDG